MLVAFLALLKLLSLGLELKRHPRVTALQLLSLLVLFPGTPVGESIDTLGLQLHKRVVAFESVPLPLHQFGHQHWSLLRSRTRGQRHPHYRLSGTSTHELRVERVPSVLLFLVSRRLVYRVVLPPGADELSESTRYLVRARLAGRVPLFDLHGQEVGGNFRNEDETR